MLVVVLRLGVGGGDELDLYRSMYLGETRAPSWASSSFIASLAILEDTSLDGTLAPGIEGV